MSFIRGKGAKASIGIGIDRKAIEIRGMGYVKSIDYAEFGESWNWKVLSPKKVHKVLSKMETTALLRKRWQLFPVFDVTLTGDGQPHYTDLAGKLIKFEGKYYRINKINEFRKR